MKNKLKFVVGVQQHQRNKEIAFLGKVLKMS